MWGLVGAALLCATIVIAYGEIKEQLERRWWRQLPDAAKLWYMGQKFMWPWHATADYHRVCRILLWPWERHSQLLPQYAVRPKEMKALRRTWAYHVYPDGRETLWGVVVLVEFGAV